MLNMTQLVGFGASAVGGVPAAISLVGTDTNTSTSAGGYAFSFNVPVGSKYLVAVFACHDGDGSPPSDAAVANLYFSETPTSMSKIVASSDELVAFGVETTESGSAFFVIDTGDIMTGGVCWLYALTDLVSTTPTANEASSTDVTQSLTIQNGGVAIVAAKDSASISVSVGPIDYTNDGTLSIDGSRYGNSGHVAHTGATGSESFTFNQAPQRTIRLAWR